MLCFFLPFSKRPSGGSRGGEKKKRMQQEEGALDSIVVEGWIVGAFTADGVDAMPGAVSAICGSISAMGCMHVVDTIADAVFYRGDAAPAVRTLCEMSGLAKAACRFRRDVAEWGRRYPQIARSLRGDTRPTLRDVVPLLCRTRVARRCALYALHAIATASTGPCVPYGALDLGALEAWAHGWHDTRVLVRSVVLEDERAVWERPTGRLLPVVADALPMEDGAGATHIVMAPSHAADVRRLINAALTRALMTQLLASDSTDGPPLSVLAAGVDIFLAYPGTRAVAVRYDRADSVSRISADLAVLVALPDP